jgi:hypothetical protein
VEGKTVSRKRKAPEESSAKPNDGWTYVTEIQINGRNVSSGTELKINGERGRFRFIRAVKTESGKEWIDVWGGAKGAEQWRSFKVDRVKRVHYKNQTIQNLAAEYKEKLAAKKAELQSDSED